MGSSATEVERLILAARPRLARGELRQAAGRATEAIRLDGKQATAYLADAVIRRSSRRGDGKVGDVNLEA